MRVCLSYLIALPGIAGIAGVTSSRGIFYRATSLMHTDGTVHAPQQAGNIVEKGHIYFVATPLGNLQDITFRAVNVLSNVDIVAAEDTRNTAKLLKLLNIKYGKLVSHHEHNWQSSTPELVRLLKEGSSVALVSDAGTPGISDPGAPLAAACALAGIPIHPIPGPSAVVSALSVCGFSSTRFTFFGFLPSKGKERKEMASEIMSSSHPAVFFEAPHRMMQSIELFQQLVPRYGERSVVCCRELTKIHEEIFRGTLSEVSAWLTRNSKVVAGGGPDTNERVRGEFTVVMSPVLDNDDDDDARGGRVDGLGNSDQRPKRAEDNVRVLLLHLKSDGLSRSESVKLVSAMPEVKDACSRSEVYRIALDIPSWD